MKKIDINWTLYETLEKYPELEDVLFSLGFEGVKKIRVIAYLIPPMLYNKYSIGGNKK